MDESDQSGSDSPSGEGFSLDLETRKTMFEYVKERPGVHFSQMRQDLDLETGELQYHLRKLEEYGVIESEKRRGKRRLFVAGELTDDERAILSMLRYETTREILLHLLEEGQARNGELADAVGVTPATISWHLSKLIEENIVESTQNGHAARYRLQNPELAIQLLVRYRETFVDRAVDRIIDFWG